MTNVFSGPKHVRTTSARVAGSLLALWLGTATWLSTPAQALSVVTPVSVGSFPRGVGVDPTTHRVYVANAEGNTLSVIDGTTNSVAATVWVDSVPSGVGVDPTTHRVYVTKEGGDSVSVIDGTTNSATTTIPLGLGDRTIAAAVDPTTHRVYVANQASNSVSVIDGTTNSITATVGFSFPRGVGVDPTTHRVYVTNGSISDSATLSVLDGTTNNVAATVRVPGGQSGVGWTPLPTVSTSPVQAAIACWCSMTACQTPPHP